MGAKLGIIKDLNIKELVKKGERLKSVQIAKSIRELEKIDIALCTNIAQKLLDELSLKLNTTQTNLSDFAKSLSDLSSIAPDLVELELKKSFSNGAFYKLLENEQSLSNITARILELNTTVGSEKDEFSEIVNQFFTSASFKILLKTEKNIYSLLSFYELVKKNDIGIFPINQNDLLARTKKQILDIDFNISILSNTKVLNIQELKEKVKKEISAELLNKVLKDSKFTIMESLFMVLTRVDKEKTIKAFNLADMNILCSSMCHKELNISQSIDVLNKTKNKTFLNDSLNSNQYCKNLLDLYLTIQREDQYEYDRLNFGDYLKAFDHSLNIDFNVAIKHFENDFLKKLKKTNNKNLTISSLFQSLRRIEQLTDSKYNREIREFLKLYKLKFLIGIKNENLAKTTSGLIELSKCDLKDFADELLHDSKNIILLKIRQLNRDKILNAKILPDIEKIAMRKSKILLTEIKARR